MKKAVEVLYRVYSFCQYFIALYFLWYGWRGLVGSQQDFPLLLLLFFFGLLLGQKLIPLNPGRDLWIVLSDLILYLVLFAFPPSITIWFTALLMFSLYVSWIFFKTFRTKGLILPNTALFTVSFGAGAFVFNFVAGGTLQKALLERHVVAIPAILLVWIVVTGIHLLNLAITLAPSRKLDFVSFLRAVPGFVQYEDLISTFLGALLAVLFRQAPFAAFLVAVPVLIFALSNEAYARTTTEFSRLMEVLLKALESSDPSGYSHSQRTALFAKELALKMGRGSEEAREVYELGLIHDLGVLAIPDAILFKQGPLSGPEWMLVRQHPLETGKFLKLFQRFRKNLLSVEAHHERIDGLGYPRGLKGEEIPVHARIIAVADAYDAMTNDRPFRKRLPKEVALRRIWMGQGRQFDADAAKALFDYLEEEPADYEYDSPLWAVAESLGIEVELSAAQMDDLHDAVILHELNPPADIFSRPGEANSFWWQVDYREHVGVTDVLRRDFPTSDEAVKILWGHHGWYSEAGEGGILFAEAGILAVSEAFVSCLAAGIDWPLALIKVKERAGTQFAPDVVRALEGVLAKGKIPFQVLLGLPDAPDTSESVES